jgi:SagB-type dehydrogenase family enzyme
VWGLEATLFHFGTKDVAWAQDYVAGERLLRRKAIGSPPPPPIKRYSARHRRTRLPTSQPVGELDEVIRGRRTWRQFGRAPVSLPDLAELLDRAFGVTQQGVSPGQGPVVLKSSPSGGACHAIEAYVLARRVDGLAPGLYHFEADRRVLALVRPGATRRDLETFLPGQPWFRTAGAVVFMTAVFARSSWRYATPRAYRALLIEAGHLCQTFLLVATRLSLAPFCTQAIADSAVERALGLDGINEGVLYAAGVGSRPAGPPRPGLPAPFKARLR